MENTVNTIVNDNDELTQEQLKEQVIELFSNNISVSIKDIKRYLEILINLDITIIDEVYDNLGCYENGVYVRWCDAYFSSEEDAIDLLKEDEYAIEAAFNCRIKFEDRPYIENIYNNRQEILDYNEVEDVRELMNFMHNNQDDIEELCSYKLESIIEMLED